MSGKHADSIVATLERIEWVMVRAERPCTYYSREQIEAFAMLWASFEQPHGDENTAIPTRLTTQQCNESSLYNDEAMQAYYC